ncbi:hypothetical protein [Rarobacter incanus]|uniref:hypothetical protein n=1 Tax=Rarobacter incanus TaxID=153494 RepID=UPI001FE9472C|nr:hypothetical protein [Rarobacter incanus]
MVDEASALVVGACVEACAVDQEPECCRDLRSWPFVLVVFVVDAPVDVGDACADAVLVAFQGIEVDGVGEVRGEDLVALALQLLPRRGQFSEFRASRGEPFVEYSLDSCREPCVLRFGNSDALVAVGDELLRNPDGYCAAGAGGAFRGAPGADVVGVSVALLVVGEVELEA